MKNEGNNLIEKQIKEKRRLPEDIKQEVNKNVYRNLLVAIMVLLYFIFINLGYYNIASHAFMTDIRIFSICLIVITVILFEKAYNESNAKLGIHGIETLIISIVTLFMQYIFFYQKQSFIIIYMTIPVFFSIYYVLKSIGITVRAKRKYFNSRSDVKDIIKKEKKKIEDDEIIEDKEVIAEEEKTKDIKKETKPKTTRTTKNTKTTDTKKATNTSNTKKITTKTKTTKTTSSKKKTEKQDNDASKPTETKEKKTTNLKRETTSRKRTNLQEDEKIKTRKTTAKPKTTTKKTTTKKEITPKEKTTKTTTTKRTTRTKKEE